MKQTKYSFKIILFLSVLIVALLGGIFSFISPIKNGGDLRTYSGQISGNPVDDVVTQYGYFDRTFAIQVNDSTLGSLGASYKSSYKTWDKVTLVAVPNSESIFLAWVDSSKGYISSALSHSLTTSNNYNITAMFAKFGGNNTQSDPLTVDSIMSIFDNYSTNMSVSVVLNRSIQTLYIKAIDGYTFKANGNALTAINGIYTISSNGAVSLEITNSNSKVLTISMTGQGLNNITEGFGTSASPYIIYNQAQLADMKLSLSAYYKLGGNITLSGTWTPISTFSGNFNGDGYSITNLKIKSGSNIGLFGVVTNATISNFDLLNADVRGGGNVGALAGQVTTSSFSNIDVVANVAGTSSVGGFAGVVDEKSTFNNMTISGNVINSHPTNCNNVGGFASLGGKYTDCIMYANVEGNKTTGGFVGGYKLDSSFTRCYMAGSVHQRSGFDNNYPYIGIANGYGAWATFTMSNSGQRINVNYTSSQAVTQIDIFNASSTADGLSVSVPTTLKDGKYNFIADAIFSGTNASLSDLFLASEVNPNGIVCNFGGMTIRFKMADGTYKYIGTLDRKSSTFKSNFDINLDELTSYVDNFASMTFNTTENTNYKTEKYNSKNTSIFGTVEVSNANDFEHLAWVINGGIPTTFGTGTTYYVNSRTTATTGIKLMADIDLTAERVVTIGGKEVYLNRVGGTKDGAMIYSFYGLGNSEMMPYRGNIYGNNKTLKVNINMPETYNVGVISASTEYDTEIQIRDLTVEGTIIGRDNVGVVGFFDSYERDANIRFTNVVNKASVTGTRWVGGLLGNGHEASVYFDNCTLWGSVTGRAYTRTDVLGYVENMASTDVGGFVGETYPDKSEFMLTANFLNTNKVYAPTNAPNASTTGYFIGACSTSTYVVNSGASNELYYTIDVKKSGVTIIINGTSYTSDENGLIYYNMGNVNRVSELPSISYTCDLLNSSSSIKVNASTLYTLVPVPVGIDFVTSGNVYETTSSDDKFIVNVVITFSNDSTSTASVEPVLSESQITSNQLIFNNTTFKNATYKIPSTLTANLKRITSNIEDYVTKYNTLNNLASGSSEFKAKYTSAKDVYDAITKELENYTSEDLARFNDYIANTITNVHKVDASKTALDAWANKIVDYVDTSNLSGLTFDYGATNTSKDVTLHFMDSSTSPLTIVFSLSKRAGYLIYDGMGSAHTIKYGEKITYTYNPSFEAEITPRILTGLTIEDKNKTYDGVSASTSASATNILNGDVVEFVFDYSGATSAINAGTYTVTVKELGGKDGIYYALPESQDEGTVVISKLALEFGVTGNTTFTYSGEGQAPQISKKVAVETDYVLNDTDYTIKYISDVYNSEAKPSNADDYIAKVTVGNNFTISGNSEFTFKINQKEITGVIIDDTEVEYVKVKPELSISITEEQGVVNGDTVKVTNYNIYTSEGLIATSYNVGGYYISVTAIDNDNYKFTNLRADFNIIKESLNIEIGDDTSVYGDEIDLSDVTYVITSGTLYDGDDLNITYTKEEGNVFGDYEISGSYSNENYDVTFEKGNYSITKRGISFTFPEYDFTYNATNQIDSVIAPTINNLADGDELSFVIIRNGVIVTEVINAGAYTIKLDESLAVLSSYQITGETHKDFEVKKKSLTINIDELQKEYKEDLSQDSFTNTPTGLEGEDKVNDLGDIVYNLTLNGEDVDMTNELDVDKYQIDAILENLTTLSNNYDITITSSELGIVKGTTSLVVEEGELIKTFSNSVVSFTPKMFNSLDEEISASFTYVYKDLNDNVIDTPINVGTYKVEISGDAGSNYETKTEIYTFSIIKNKVSVTFEGLTHTYNKQNYKPTVTITLEQGLLASEFTNVKYYLADKLDDELTGDLIDADTYKVVVSLTDSTNFEFVTAYESLFEIKKEKLTIEISDETSVYGDEISLSNVTHKITSGILYNGDDLNIIYSKEEGKVFGNYEISGSYSNDNYDVTFISGTYSITKCKISFTFPEYDLTYNATNQINEVTLPTVTNLVTGDVLSYIISKGSVATSEVINEGTYKIALDTTLEVLNNYEIDGVSYKEFKVKQKDLEIKVNNVQRNFKQSLSVSDFTSSVTGLQGGHKLSDLLTLVYSLSLNNEPVEISSELAVNDYVINVEISNPTQLSHNYKISITPGTLYIIEGETYVEIGSEQLTKTYNGNAIAFTAKMFTNLDEELSATFEYVFKNLNDEIIDAPTEVGNYKVEVVGDAGSNYESATQSYNFAIIKNKVSVAFSNLTHTYNKQDFKPTVSITLEEGLNAEDYTQIQYYLDGISVTSTIDADEYSVVVSLLDTENFQFVTSSQSSFVINKEKLNITISNETSIYGDAISLDNVTHEITSGILYQGDDLNITYSKNLGTVVGNYSIKGNYTNDNYDIYFTFGTYSITRREISFTFPEYDLTYDATNQIDKVTKPTINNLATGDKLEFIISRDNIPVTYIVSADTYKIALDSSLEVLSNYKVVGSSYKIFKIKQRALTITPNDVEYRYKQNIDISSFISVAVGLQGGHEISDLGQLEYSLTLNGEPIEFYNTLPVNDYTLNINFKDCTTLYNDYDITLNSGVLSIIAGRTSMGLMEGELVKTYTSKAVVFNPYMFDNTNNAISANFTYVYKNLNNEVIPTPINVGSYKVQITADGGSNYEKAIQTYTFEIVKNKVSVEFSNLTRVYNKQDFKPTINITLEQGLDANEFTEIKYYIVDGDEVVTSINVASYKAVVELKDTTNFEFISSYETNYSITVNEIEVTIGNESSVYGSEISLDDVITIVSKGTLYRGDNLNIVLTKEAGETVGTYKISALCSNDNYKVTFVDGVYSITPNEIELKFSGLTNFTYTGSEFKDMLSVDLTGLYGIVTSWYSDKDGQEVESIIDAGTYALKVKLIDTLNYCFKDEENTLLTYDIFVGQQVLDLTIEANSRDYNGLGYSEFTIKTNDVELSKNLYSVEFYNGEDKLSSAPVDFGTYTLKVVENDKNNYKFNSLTTTFNINQILIELSYGKTEFVYNRMQQKTSVSIANIVNAGEVTLNLEYSGGDFIDVNNYLVEVKGISGTKAHNYKLPNENLSKQFEIKCASVDVDYGKLKHNYLGRQLTETDLQISFDGNIDVYSSDYSISELPTTVGNDYNVKLTCLNDNIVFTNTETLVTINPAIMSGITLTSVAYPYDGRVKSLSVNTVDLFDGSKAEVVYENNTHTDKGEYYVTATLTNENFHTLVLEAILTINTRVYSVSYVGSVNYTYNKEKQGMIIASIDNEHIASLLSVRYIGVNGTDYASNEIPTDVGNYKIIVESLNTDNLTVANPENYFNINNKSIIVKNIVQKLVTFDANAHGYEFEYTGVVSGDEVVVNVLYDGEPNMPINAGRYKVTIGSLGGKNGSNYMYDDTVSSYLIISPKDINVSAIYKEVTYGDSDVELTYVADELYSGDEFTGALVRSPGKNVNEYNINIGTLSAGDNYNIVFNSAKYKIVQRPITFEVDTRLFTYDGQEKLPNVTINNFAYQDENVAVMNFIGDKVNAGTFIGQISILNSNYKLPANYSDVVFTIDKKDVSSAIIGLIKTKTDYSGSVITPMVMINEVDNKSLGYKFEYKLNDNDVPEIKNAGNYVVTVVIDEANYKGSKEFEFVVNTIQPEYEEVVNDSFMVYSYKIVAPVIANAVYKLGDGQWVSSNVFDGLVEDTNYVISIKILATTNTDAKDLGEFNITTGLSAPTVNAMFNHIQEFSVEYVSDIRRAYNAQFKVSEYEIGDVNTTKLNDLVTAFENYIETLDDEVVASNVVAKNVLGNLDVVFYILNIFTLFIIAMAVVRFRAR